MKIVFTGGGTGGHFYPIIAVASEINAIAQEKKLFELKLFYIGPDPYDARALYENGIVFKHSSAGKLRRYFSILNFFDLFKTALGSIRSIWQLYRLYPDVVFSKGGYTSFPTVMAARILRIPVVIHESDASPGRVNSWAGKFARKIAVSYPEVANSFEAKNENVAFTGNPVRRELYNVGKRNGDDFFKLDHNIPTILILGGSQGSQRINDVVLDSLPKLVEKYQIVHQTGKKSFEEVDRTSKFILRENPHKSQYRAFAFLNVLELRMAAGAATLVISRAGSGGIFEIAAWGLPSIILPIPEDISHDQHKNAFAYARTGAAVVIEDKNLTTNLLIYEIDRLIEDKELYKKMKGAASKFSTPNAARAIAEAIIKIAEGHEA